MGELLSIAKRTNHLSDQTTDSFYNEDGFASDGENMSAGSNTDCSEFSDIEIDELVKEESKGDMRAEESTFSVKSEKPEGSVKPEESKVSIKSENHVKSENYVKLEDLEGNYIMQVNVGYL